MTEFRELFGFSGGGGGYLAHFSKLINPHTTGATCTVSRCPLKVADFPVPLSFNYTYTNVILTVLVNSVRIRRNLSNDAGLRVFVIASFCSQNVGFRLRPAIPHLPISFLVSFTHHLAHHTMYIIYKYKPLHSDFFTVMISYNLFQFKCYIRTASHRAISDNLIIKFTESRSKNVANLASPTLLLASVPSPPTPLHGGRGAYGKMLVIEYFTLSNSAFDSLWNFQRYPPALLLSLSFRTSDTPCLFFHPSRWWHFPLMRLSSYILTIPTTYISSEGSSLGYCSHRAWTKFTLLILGKLNISNRFSVISPILKVKSKILNIFFIIARFTNNLCVTEGLFGSSISIHFHV